MDLLFGGVLFLGLWLVVVTGIKALPLLIAALVPSQIRRWFLDVEKSERLIRATASPEVKGKVAQLQALGFELLGIKAEKVWWRKVVHEIALTSVELDAFGSIILNQNKKAADVYFYTPFAGGGLALTRARSPLPEMESENSSVKNVPIEKTERLLASHRQRVRDFKRKGLAPLAVDSQEARLEADRFYHTTAYAKRAGRAILLTPAVRNFLVLLALLLAGAGYYLVRLLTLPAG